MPGHYLPEGSYFDHKDQTWVWRSDAESLLYFDAHETVRFKIESEEWVDQSPLGPSEKEEGRVLESPYKIVVSFLSRAGYWRWMSARS